MLTILAVCNIALCGWRFFATLNAGRMISITWFLMAYFAIFFLPLSFEFEIKWIRGFFAEPATAHFTEIVTTFYFTVLFNILFAATEIILWALIKPKTPRFDWVLSKQDLSYRPLIALLFAYWLIGSVWYLYETMSSNYRQYVESASWAVVFFWAGSPLIVLLAMQKRRVAAFCLCLPYLYIASHLDVRSFALLSLVPALIVSFYQIVGPQGLRGKSLMLIRNALIGGVLLVAISIFISQDKNQVVSFPDSGMPYGIPQVIKMVDKYDAHNGFDSLTLYGWNFIQPFMKLFGIEKPVVKDGPVVIAQLLQGVPDKWSVFYHFPSLIWADAYVAFAWSGLLMAVFWAVLLTLWDRVMYVFPIVLIMLLPFYAWHSYMLVRGATGVASVPFAYAAYFSFFAFYGVLKTGLFKRVRRESVPVFADAESRKSGFTIV